MEVLLKKAEYGMSCTLGIASYITFYIIVLRMETMLESLRTGYFPISLTASASVLWFALWRVLCLCLPSWAAPLDLPPHPPSVLGDCLRQTDRDLSSKTHATTFFWQAVLCQSRHRNLSLPCLRRYGLG